MSSECDFINIVEEKYVKVRDIRDDIMRDIWIIYDTLDLFVENPDPLVYNDAVVLYNNIMDIWLPQWNLRRHFWIWESTVYNHLVLLSNTIRQINNLT